MKTDTAHSPTPKTESELDQQIENLSGILSLWNQLSALVHRVERLEAWKAERELRDELEGIDMPHPLCAYSLPEIGNSEGDS